MEIFLLHLLDQEEGERPRDPGADGMRGHPPPGAASGRVHALPARSNKGWHSHWFYLKNDPAAPFPIFSEHLVEEVPPSWLWGPPIKEKKWMRNLLKAIVFLKTHGLHGAGVI